MVWTIGHVVRRDEESILKKAMMLRGRPKQTWKRQVDESLKKIELRVEEGYRSREMERGSESDCWGNEVHPATLGHEEKSD